MNLPLVFLAGAAASLVFSMMRPSRAEEPSSVPVQATCQDFHDGYFHTNRIFDTAVYFRIMAEAEMAIATVKASEAEAALYWDGWETNGVYILAENSQKIHLLVKMSRDGDSRIYQTAASRDQVSQEWGLESVKVLLPE